MMWVVIVLTLAFAWAMGMWRGERARQREDEARYLKAHKAESQARAEDANRLELLNNILQELSAGILVADKNMQVIYSNQRLSTLLPGVRNLVGKKLLELVRDHQIEELAVAVRSTGEGKTQRLRLPDTRERVLEVEAVPLPEKAGGGVKLVIYDVTERVQAEQVRRDFVANASHELRTPLTLINGYTETLLEGGIADSAVALNCLQVMDRHGKRILRIVEDMLSIARLESDTSMLTMEPFNVRECVDTVLEQLHPLIEQRKPLINLDFPEEGGVLVGDRFYWDQVYANLIENALKENPRPGLVITVSGHWSEDVCTLIVCDNGVGIPEHDRPFVFKRFFRGAKHHTHNVKGTGLGLSIVLRAVEAHGGKIELRSTPGEETVFTMTVPLRRQEDSLRHGTSSEM